MNSSQYEKQWEVPSESDEKKTYTVSLKKDGTYVCHCWPFLRNRQKECKHILLVKGGQGRPVSNLTAEERGNLLLQTYAREGLRFIKWYPLDMMPWDRRDWDAIKRNVRYERVERFKYEDRWIIVAKERPEVYEKEIDFFVQKLEKCDFSKDLVRNPHYKTTDDPTFLPIDQVKERFRKEFFDISQHVLFNSSGIVMNPNLTPELVAKLNKRMNELVEQYPFLK